MRKYVNILEELMQEHIPLIHQNLRCLDISPDLFIIDWFLTLFSKALPLDIAGRIWDNYFYEGLFWYQQRKKAYPYPQGIYLCLGVFSVCC
jgi:hypothetical protein